jgi:hypothetical protein
VDAVNEGAGFVGAIFTSALDTWAAKTVLIIATVGQTSAGRPGSPALRARGTRSPATAGCPVGRFSGA